jgi:L-lactate dehydrogenase complex protein LldE
MLVKVGLFITCVNDMLYPGTGIAVTRVLERLGHTVEFPLGQTCCGQMHANSGFAELAKPIAEQYVRVFEGYDAIVAPSGSCVAMVRDQYRHLVPGSADVVARTYELSELLVDVLGVTDTGARFPHKVTYHPTCHGLRLLHLGDKPLQLLRAVRDIELVELAGATECCGFGGTFALKNSGVSTAMLEDKCANIRRTGADLVVAADNSCLTHIGGGLSRLRAGIRALHYAEVLAA